MPYVSEDVIGELANGRKPEHPGELNFLITHQLVRYIEANGLDYQTINDVLGALDGASKEFYRRVAVPYEEKKRRINGDVYPGRMTGQ